MSADESAHGDTQLAATVWTHLRPEAALMNDAETMAYIIADHGSSMKPEYIATLRKYAAIARALESEEWKLVPALCSEDMLDEAREGYSDVYDGLGSNAAAMTEALHRAIAAAPQFQEE